MRRLSSVITAASVVAISTMLISPAVAQTLERPTLTAAQCQPLTEANAELCCIALNRQDILSGAQIEQCPPMTTALIARAIASMNDNGGSVGVDDVTPGTPDVDEGTTGTVDNASGNPGNLNNVGNAGEAPSNGEGEGFGSGNDDKGKSN